MGQKTRGLAVVTGASSGIGFELAKQFAKNDFDVLICAEDQGIESAAEELKKFGHRVDFMQVDLREYDQVKKFYNKIIDCGPATALALNAGVGLSGSVISHDIREELAMIDLNVKSVVHLANLVAKDMALAGRGKILFTSAVAAIYPGPFMTVYAATKAFVESYAAGLCCELKDTGVGVTALLPGLTETHFYERAHLEDTKTGQGKKDDPEKVAEDGFNALMHGKDKVFAGSFMNKVQGIMRKFVSEKAAASIHRRDSEPGRGRR